MTDLVGGHRSQRRRSELRRSELRRSKLADQQFVDATAIHVDHLDDEASPPQRVACRWNPLEFGKHEPRYG